MADDNVTIILMIQVKNERHFSASIVKVGFT
jgi:hypothetical protein